MKGLSGADAVMIRKAKVIVTKSSMGKMMRFTQNGMEILLMRKNRAIRIVSASRNHKTN